MRGSLVLFVTFSRQEKHARQFGSLERASFYFGGQMQPAGCQGKPQTLEIRFAYSRRML